MANIRSLISCASCTYFKQQKIFGKPCSELGFTETSKPCVSYVPDIKTLRTPISEQNPVIDLLRLISKLEAIPAEALAFILVSQARLKKYSNYVFMQPVVFQFCGSGQYVNNYCRAYVIDCTKTDIRLINRTGTFTISLPVTSTTIYSVKDFVALKNTMIERNKLIDPRNNNIASVAKIDDLQGHRKHKVGRPPRSLTHVIRQSV